jgi:hypothetical protein
VREESVTDANNKEADESFQEEWGNNERPGCGEDGKIEHAQEAREGFTWALRSQSQFSQITVKSQQATQVLETADLLECRVTKT